MRSCRLIIGSEFRLDDGLRLVLLATDRAGYGRLAALITTGRRNAVKGSYRLTRADLADGVTGCLALWLPGRAPAIDEAHWLATRFPGCLWIAGERLLDADDAARCKSLIAIADALALPIVAAGDVHMHAARAPRAAGHADRDPAQDLGGAGRTMPCIPTASAICGRCRRSSASILRAWLAETLVIAGRCRFSLDELRYEYPEEIVPAGETPTSYLRRLTEQGFARAPFSGASVRSTAN